jgi:hypothetical protein
MNVMQPHTTGRCHRLPWLSAGPNLGVFPLLEVLAPLVLLCLTGCSSEAVIREKEQRLVLQQLQLVEIQLPMSLDSILARYQNYDSASFFQRYSQRMGYATSLIDSMNSSLPDSLRIDTLAIDHSLQDFGEAGRSRNIFVVSLGYFIAYDDPAVLRSIIFHEFGHIAFDRLSEPSRQRFEALWFLLKRNALFYLFRDGEYSGNARFGGHPEDSPAELFASAFNLLHNQLGEFRSRMLFVERIHFGAISEIAAMTSASFSFQE